MTNRNSNGLDICVLWLQHTPHWSKWQEGFFYSQDDVEIQITYWDLTWYFKWLEGKCWFKTYKVHPPIACFFELLRHTKKIQLVVYLKLTTIDHLKKNPQIADSTAQLQKVLIPTNLSGNYPSHSIISFLDTHIWNHRW